MKKRTDTLKPFIEDLVRIDPKGCTDQTEIDSRHDEEDLLLETVSQHLAHLHAVESCTFANEGRQRRRDCLVSIIRPPT